MEQPVYFWTPDIAPAGIAFYSGKLIPGWRDNLFVAALAGKHLARWCWTATVWWAKSVCCSISTREFATCTKGLTARSTS